MLIHETISKLNAMKLYGMARAYNEFHQTSKSGEMSLDEALGMLVDREQLDRDNRATTRRIRTAKLRETALVEDIDWNHKRELDKGAFKSLISCEWIKRHRNLILVGATGLGKTWLACALAQQACTLGMTSRFFRIPRLFDQINLAKAQGHYDRFIRILTNTDLLIFDDWGQTLNETERRDFREIIEDRHGRGSLIITSQVPVNRWHEIIGDPTLADATVDRKSKFSTQPRIEGGFHAEKETGKKK